MRLSERLFREGLEGYSIKAKQLEEIVEAVAHIAVDFGYGTFELTQEHIQLARDLLPDNE